MRSRTGWPTSASTTSARRPPRQSRSAPTVLQDVLAVGDFGLMSVIRDPAGATVAMWQAVGGK